MIDEGENPGARLTRQQNLLPDLIAINRALVKMTHENAERMKNRNPNKQGRKPHSKRDKESAKRMESPAPVIVRRDINPDRRNVNGK